LKVKECPYIPSRVRLGLSHMIALMVISSPIVMLSFDPALVLAYPGVTDTSSSHATLPKSADFSSPSMSSLASPTIQAPLQIPRTLQSTDLVNSLAFYEITFITSTTGAIDKIRMDFPAGTGVGAAGIIERVGIGGGTLLKSGSSITYDVTSPVSIPAGTFIRLEMFGIKNPITPSTTFTADITTRTSGGALIDGPSTTNVYTIKKVGSSDLADGSVTSTKPSESFMKRVLIFDNDAGHAVGWNPDGVTTSFTISPAPGVMGGFTEQIVLTGGVSPGPLYSNCGVTQLSFDSFSLICEHPPADGIGLRYLRVDIPTEIV
jgi:hypothetical protein